MISVFLKHSIYEKMIDIIETSICRNFPIKKQVKIEVGYNYYRICSRMYSSNGKDQWTEIIGDITFGHKQRYNSTQECYEREWSVTGDVNYHTKIGDSWIKSNRFVSQRDVYINTDLIAYLE